MASAESLYNFTFKQPFRGDFFSGETCKLQFVYKSMNVGIKGSILVEHKNYPLNEAEGA